MASRLWTLLNVLSLEKNTYSFFILKGYKKSKYAPDIPLLPIYLNEELHRYKQ
jgi:hypothetical protein